MKAALGIGFLSALVAALLGGWVAVKAVDWYQISSREGASGFFVVFVALGAALAGLALGVITSRIVAAQWQGGFGAQLGGAIAVVVLCTAAAAAAARSLAHVPPTINGDALHVAVELSWPAGDAPNFASDTAPPYLSIGTQLGARVVESVNGPLFTDLAREENGRRIVPGVVPLVSTRGARVLMLERGADGDRTGYVLPLPSSPGAAERAWSEWLPRAAAGAAPLPDGVRYRVRVLAQSEPVRTDTVGAFAVDLIAEYSNGGASRALSTNARYHITHGGAPVTRPDSGDITAAWVVNAPSPALLVQTRGPSSDWRCALLWDEAGTLRTQTLGRCERPMHAALLDGATSHVARTARLDDGTMDRTTFAVPGVYLLAEAVLDTRTLAVTAMDNETASALTPWFAPIGLSPDGQRFVRAISDNDTMQLMEITLPTFEMRALPLAHVVLPTGDWDDADGAWFAHHFEWRANATGVQQAQPRANITPLVRRGVLKREPTGDSYDVRRVQRALRTEVLMHLAQTIGADLVTDDGNPADDRAAPRSDDGVPFSRRIRLRNAEVQVSWIRDGQRLSVWVYPGVDATLVPMIAERLDAQLATRAWDAFFVPAGAP